MARIGKKRLILTIVIIITIIVVGGYFARDAVRPGVANAPDSTADSTLAAADSTSKEGKNGKGDEDEKKEPDPVPVEIALVAPREISSFYHTTATLDPEKKVDCLAKIAGEITKLLVEEGDVVTEGQQLCQIEDTEYRIALEEATINRDQKRREYERVQALQKQNLISEKEFSDAKYQYELAENSYAASKLKYDYTQVRAPFDGIVTKRHVEPGQHATVGTALFEIIDVSPLLVRMYLPENEIRDIGIGQEVSIHPDHNPDQVLIGRVIRIAPEVDQRSGTVKVTAETRGHAMPGSFARVKIVTDVHAKSLTIPRRGLVSDAGDLYVYVAEADTVRKTAVVVGYQDEDFAEVIDGVEPGDSVVVVGVGGLRTGTKVKIVEPTMQEALSQTSTSK